VHGLAARQNTQDKKVELAEEVIFFVTHRCRWDKPIPARPTPVNAGLARVRSARTSMINLFENAVAVHKRQCRTRGDRDWMMDYNRTSCPYE
jgi:hypothetical protein